MHDEPIPRIKASLIIEGQPFDFTHLTDSLDVEPSETRSIDEWPKGLQNNDDLPAFLKPRAQWIYETNRKLGD